MKVSVAKGKPPELRVVFDSSAIFTGTASDLLQRDVDEMIRAHAGHPDLAMRWYLPEIVQHERQFQMLEKGLELLPSIEKLERVLGHSLAVTKDVIEERIKATVSRQLQEKNLELQPLDAARVDWPRIALDAAYRRAPFERGEKEKGFRDALVLETFMQIVEASPTTAKVCRVVLLTGDKLMADVAEARCVDRSNVSVLRSLDELKGLINALVTEVDEEFVAAIKPKANEYFFVKDEKDTLYYKEEIRKAIREKFGEQLAAVATGASRRENGTWFIQPPRFVKKERQRVFWATRITVEAKAFAYDFPQVKLGLFSSLEAMPVFGAGLLTPSTPSDATQPPTTAFQATSLFGQPLQEITLQPGTIARPFITPASQRTERLINGKSVFEVSWSVVVSTTQKLSKGRVESLDFVETAWDA